MVPLGPVLINGEVLLWPDPVPPVEVHGPGAHNLDLEAGEDRKGLELDAMEYRVLAGLGDDSRSVLMATTWPGERLDGVWVWELLDRNGDDLGVVKGYFGLLGLS